jgi:DNA-binding NtrC family response regulator
MSEQALSILVVDDETIVRASLADWFREEGYRVDAVESGAEALRRVAASRYDIALVDVKMPKMDGLELQARLTAADPDLTVVIMTAYASVETAVRALKAGAYDYIVKPFDPDELTHLIQRAKEHRSLKSENVRLRQSLEARSDPAPVIGRSAAMRRVLDAIEAVAGSDATVLIRGESGTGKELVARAIHTRSPRRFNPLVEVHCGALAEGILESELFGHEKGAFTGAHYHHKGKFEQADGGTIFLDEIGDVSPRVQVELLRVLEEKAVTRVGGKRPIPVDFRVVAATNRDLDEEMRRGQYRADLFWRLNVVAIEVPPLRERPEDIVALAEHFLDRFALSMNRKGLTLAPETVDVLRAYPWPGNVRELQNSIERAVVLGTPPLIRPQDLPVHVRAPAPGLAPARTLEEVERAHIQAVIEEAAWNISGEARVLDVDRGTLYNKIRKYGLQQAHGV